MLLMRQLEKQSTAAALQQQSGGDRRRRVSDARSMPEHDEGELQRHRPQTVVSHVSLHSDPLQRHKSGGSLESL